MYSQSIDLNRFSSIQAVAERETLSKKYSFIPTTKVISAFEQKGWLPVKASEVRATGKEGKMKYIINHNVEIIAENYNQAATLFAKRQHGKNVVGIRVTGDCGKSGMFQAYEKKQNYLNSIGDNFHIRGKLA